MAKKTVPLNKPKGTNGQGNIQVPGGPVVLDLGDFDDLFGPAEDSPKTGPLGEFWEGLKESFSDRLRTKDVVRNFLRSAAPDGISNLMGFADEAMSATRDIKDSLERTNASDLQYIAKRAQALLPKLQEYAPDGMYNDISQGLENKIEEYDYTIQSQRDQTAIRRAAQERTNDNEVRAALDNIALTDKLNHNRSEQAAQIRHNQGRAEESIRDVLRTKRFDFMAKSMGMAVDSLQRLTGYTEQVNYGFQRKGLELQFRSYLGIKELIKLSEANLELNARAYNAMIRNTGMSDFQKHGAKGLTEMGKAGSKPGIMSRVGQQVANRTLSGFLGNYGNEAQSRVTQSISQQLSMAVMALKMGEGGPNLWDQKYRIAGQMAGDYGSDFLLNEIIPMLGREARPGMEKLSNKYAGGKHNQIGYYLDNMPAFLQEFVNNNQNQYGVKGKIRDLIAPFVPQFGLQDRTTSGSFQTIDQPAQFNQLTQRTIVDAIPGYLARILQTLRMIRSGRDDVAREVWDVTTGTFKAESAAHDSLRDKIVPKNAVRSASATINDALNTMDEDGQLSPQARQALSERMLRDSSTNRRFDPDAYIKARGYADGTSPEVTAELDKFFKTKFEYDDQGSMVDNAKNHKLRQEFSQAFLDIRSISRDPIKEIQRMINTGNTEPLRAIGILITKDGQDRINYPRIWEILRSGVTDNNPYAPGGGGFDPNKDDQSGTVGHKDFVGPAWSGQESAWAKNTMSRFRSRYAPEEQLARDKMARHLKTLRGRFGSAANQMKDMMDGDQAGQLTPNGLNYSATIKGGYAGQMPGMTGTNLAGYDQFINKAVQESKGYGVKGMENLTDLYSQFDPTKPIIKGIDFSNGDLIDVNTKQIIKDPKGITGEVINRLGQTVVTAAEAAAGLLSPSGELVTKAAENTSQIVGKALGLNQPKGTGSGDAADKDPDSEEQLNSQDWSLGPGETAVLTSRGLKGGEYFDSSGKIINSIKEIAGDVYDKAGNVVLTAKEFANGLWSKRTGTKYRPTKNFAKLLKAGKMAGKFAGQTAGQMVWGAAKFTAKAAAGMASRVFNFFVDNQNAYLPGEKLPVLTRRAVQNGEYYDENGGVVDDFVDVYSLLYDSRGELVLPPEQYKLLTNFDGTPHILAKNKRIWSKYVMRPIRAMRNMYLNQTKKYYKWLGRSTVKAGSWLGRKTLGGFAKAGGSIFNRMFEKVPEDQQGTVDATAAGVAVGTQPQTQMLGEILDELKAQRPKEIRKGSWQDQANRAGKASDQDKDSKDDDPDKKDGFLKRGLKGLAGLLGFGKKGKDDEDDGFGLSDAADLADIADSVGNSRERGRKRKEGSGGRKKGRLARWGGKIANSKIGKAIGGSAIGRFGGAAIARGAMMAGTALATLVSGPVLIGAAAVGSVAGAGYWMYSRYRDTHGDFREYRLAQYGISSTGEQLKVLKLEALMEKFTDKNSPTPAFNISGAGGKDILSILGIDIENERAVLTMARWLESRFKPIYLAYQAALSKLGQSQVKINEIDEKLPEELKGDLLEQTKFPYTSESPYGYRANPFDPDTELKDNIAEISKLFDKLKDKFYDAKKKKTDEEAKKTETPATKEADKAKVDPKAVAGVTAGAGAVSAAKKLAAEKVDDVPKTDNNKVDKDVAKAVGGTGALALSGTIQSTGERVGRSLTGLQAIRMRGYGMQALNLADVRAVLQLEAIYAKDVTVSEAKVDYTGKLDDLLSKAGQLLGMDTSTGSSDRPKLYNWLIYRFAPVFRAYFGTARNAQPAANLKGLESKLTASDKITVANAMLGAVTSKGETIWEVPTIFDVSGDPKELKKLADADLKALEKDAEKELLSSPTQKSSDQMAGKAKAAQGGSFLDGVMDTAKDVWQSSKDTLSSAWNKASSAVGNAYDGAKMALGMGPDYGGDGTPSGGTVAGGGTVGSVVQGNGGKWETIPYPATSGSIKSAYPTLKAVSEITGVPLDWLLCIAGIESGFQYNVKAGTSSATGWFQFIDDTWDFMYAACVKKYGLPPDPGKTRTARKDPRINALLGAEYIKDNWKGLKSVLKREVSDVDVYMAHFLGLGGATKFFSADPNALAYRVFKKEYSANMPLFFVDSKKSQPRTIAGIYELFRKKIENFWKFTGKGYRTSDPGQAVTEMTPQADNPGPNGPVSTDQELMTDSLKEDAKDKNGVAAQADDSAEDKRDPDVPSAPSNPTLSSTANSTSPMPGAPTTGGGSGGGSTVNAAGTSSGSDVGDTERQAQLDAAQAQNQRRANEVQRDQKVANDVAEIATRQLNTLREIRDLMKQAVDTLKSNQTTSGSSQSSGSSAPSGGSNSMTPNNIQSRQAQQRPSALTLR